MFDWRGERRTGLINSDSEPCSFTNSFLYYDFSEHGIKNKTITTLGGLYNCFYVLQTITRTEYERWAREHLEAESSLEDREEKLLNSAMKIEVDLELLGATGKIVLL